MEKNKKWNMRGLDPCRKQKNKNKKNKIKRIFVG